MCRHQVRYRPRSNREAELVKKFPADVTCGCIGNSGRGPFTRLGVPSNFMGTVSWSVRPTPRK